jgi:5-methylcytosine-specific restriction protein A
MLGWLWGKRDEELGRSGQWARVRREHLAVSPSCIACGRARDVEVHHVVPYHERPDLELDPTNLVTLCADPCHLVFGHLLSWRRSNPHVREDAHCYMARVRAAT